MIAVKKYICHDKETKLFLFLIYHSREKGQLERICLCFLVLGLMKNHAADISIHPHARAIINMSPYMLQKMQFLK